VESFELVLILFVCIIASSVLDQVVQRGMLPLIQIAVGLVVALIVPHASHIEIDPELFLVLFIAPLLFNEARESSKMHLWQNRWSILSLAIGLVLASVLVVGYALHGLVPSIPLAAAFALGAALGPTDAAAVNALASSVSLSKRQETLLSGESLINDASGVVSFQFAIAAAVTGAFSAAEALREFGLLFVGGIVVGAALGFAARTLIVTLRQRGLESTMVHVLYEVVTPLVLFLVAEEVGVSGILAVVAGGIVMAQRANRLSSTDDARKRMVSDSVWELIVFLVNGSVFVLLGMQLPLAMSATVTSASPLFLVGVVLVITALLVAVRFVWVSAMELIDRARSGDRGRTVDAALHDALVTTLAGPKGAVTLSIILTIPLVTDTGAFPERDLIIFLTAGTILATLLLAVFALPRLAPNDTSAEVDPDAVRRGAIRVLEATIAELREHVAENTHPEYEPATRLTIAHYRTRLARERFSREGCGDIMLDLVNEVLRLQQERADELQSQVLEVCRTTEIAPYYDALRSIRRSIGYFDSAENVGARFHTTRGRLALAWHDLKRRYGGLRTEQDAAVYYDTCIFAIELERVAIEFCTQTAAADEGRRGHIAGILLEEHYAAFESLLGRINYQREDADTTAYDPTTGMPDLAFHRSLPEGLAESFKKQFRMASEYADMVDASALTIELDHIRRMAQEGALDDAVARQLRENVYVLQMSLEE